MVYDLCNINEESTVEITLTSKSESFDVVVKGQFDKVEKFGIICPDLAGDFFIPR